MNRKTCTDARISNKFFRACYIKNIDEFTERGDWYIFRLSATRATVSEEKLFKFINFRVDVQKNCLLLQRGTFDSIFSHNFPLKQLSRYDTRSAACCEEYRRTRLSVKFGLKSAKDSHEISRLLKIVKHAWGCRFKNKKRLLLNRIIVKLQKYLTVVLKGVLISKKNIDCKVLKALLPSQTFCHRKI